MKRDLVIANLILNLNGEAKGYVLWNDTEAYYKKLRVAYIDISKEINSEYLYFGFFTLSAATLEYSLNFILTHYCLNNYGPDNYKSHAEGYINISFAKKLLMAPSIISNGNLRFDDNSATYKTLCELISLRNKILHNKEFLKVIDLRSLNLQGDIESIDFQMRKEPNYIDTLDKELCLKFGKALGDFKDLIMNPALENDLCQNEILLKV